ISKKPRDEDKRSKRPLRVDSGIRVSTLGNHIEPSDLADFIGEARSRLNGLRNRGETDQVVHNTDLMGMILTMDGLYDPEKGEFVDHFEIRGPNKRNLKNHLEYQHSASDAVMIPSLAV